MIKKRSPLSQRFLHCRYDRIAKAQRKNKFSLYYQDFTKPFPIQTSHLHAFRQIICAKYSEIASKGFLRIRNKNKQNASGWACCRYEGSKNTHARQKTQPLNVRFPLTTIKKHLELSINKNMEVNLTWPQGISLKC